MSKQAFVSTEGFRYGYFTRSKSDPQLSLCITGFVLGSGWKVLFCIGPEWMEPSGAQAKIWGLGSYSNHPRGPFRWQVAHTQTLLIFSQRQGGQGSLAGREENWPKCPWQMFVCGQFGPFRTCEIMMHSFTTEVTNQYAELLPMKLQFTLMFGTRIAQSFRQVHQPR